MRKPRPTFARLPALTSSISTIRSVVLLTALTQSVPKVGRSTTREQRSEWPRHFLSGLCAHAQVALAELLKLNCSLFRRSHGAYGPGDAEAVAAELLETEQGAASVDALPGKGGTAKRWVFETRKTLAMLTRAEKKTVSDSDRDSAITERAFELASSGPFAKIVNADGGDASDNGAAVQKCIEVLSGSALITSIRPGWWFWTHDGSRCLMAMTQLHVRQPLLLWG